MLEKKEERLDVRVTVKGDRLNIQVYLLRQGSVAHRGVADVLIEKYP